MVIGVIQVHQPVPCYHLSHADQCATHALTLASLVFVECVVAAWYWIVASRTDAIVFAAELRRDRGVLVIEGMAETAVSADGDEITLHRYMATHCNGVVESDRLRPACVAGHTSFGEV